MSAPKRHLTLVDDGERLPLKVGESVLYYRRLSLGALASLERMQAVSAPVAKEGLPRASAPSAALEGAVVAHVLVGWEGVTHPLSGAEVPFSPLYARRLPAGVRRLLVARAQDLNPPGQGGKNELRNPDHRP